MKTAREILSEAYIKFEEYEFVTILEAMEEYAQAYHEDQIHKIMEAEAKLFDENNS